MKVYLDTSVVSAIAKDDTPTQAAASIEILRLFDEGKLELVTSKIIGTEIERYRGEGRRNIEVVYRLLKKVPFVDDHKVLGVYSQWDWLGGGSTGALVEDHPTSSKLRQLGLDKTDAHHLMLAVSEGCDVFLTCDQRTILKWRVEVEAQFPIRLMRPSELVAEILRPLEGSS